MRIDLTLEESARPADVAATASLLGNGLPAIGFAITQRTFGQANLNYAGLVDHSYQGRGVVTYLPPTARPEHHCGHDLNPWIFHDPSVPG